MSHTLSSFLSTPIFFQHLYISSSSSSNLTTNITEPLLNYTIGLDVLWWNYYPYYKDIHNCPKRSYLIQPFP